MQPEALKFVRDMDEAARDIAGFVATKTYDQYLQDKQLRMAVERGFEIIGEALVQLRDRAGYCGRAYGLAGNYRISECADSRIQPGKSR